MTDQRKSKNLISRYSLPSVPSLSRNEFFPELVAMLEKRATRESFEGCGVLVSIVKFSDGGYLVNVMLQYAVGGKQYRAESKNFNDVRSAYGFANEVIRSHYHKVAERKFAVDVLKLEDVSQAEPMMKEAVSRV